MSGVRYPNGEDECWLPNMSESVIKECSVFIGFLV